MPESYARQLPAAIVEVQQLCPWEQTAEITKSLLGRQLPPLAAYIHEMDPAVFGLHSGFFYLPVGQALAWGGMTAALAVEWIVTLSIGHVHFACQDAIIDGEGCQPEAALLSDACLLLYLDRLSDAAPKEDPDRYRRLHWGYFLEYLRAHAIELDHRRKLRSWRPSEIRALALKAAPGSTVLHAVCDSSRMSVAAGEFVRSTAEFCLGLQMLDDVTDAVSDYQTGNYTPAVTAALLALQSRGKAPETEDFEAALYASGAADACFAVAEAAFMRARVDAAAENVLRELADLWLERTNERRRRCAEAARVLDGA